MSDLEEIVEEEIMSRLYAENGDEAVEVFMEQYKGSVISSEMARQLSIVDDLIEEKINEINDLIDDMEDGEEEE